MQLVPIGVVHSPFREAADTPIQPCYAAETEGTVEVFPPFADGLKDLAGFERVWLVFWCHRACEPKLTVVPYRDRVPHGLFATRAPARPNPIGLSPVRLLGVQANLLRVAESDILDGTPILDIKPYVSEYDSYPGQRRGWLDLAGKSGERRVADNRFLQATSES
mgnify:CR=1 FL=1